MADDDADGASFRSDVSSPDVPSSDEDDKRYCWVCFATDEDDETAAWVQPCNCRGTTKWVSRTTELTKLSVFEEAPKCPFPASQLNLVCSLFDLAELRAMLPCLLELAVFEEAPKCPFPASQLNLVCSLFDLAELRAMLPCFQVHQACIQRWVDEKQKGNTGGKVSCPQCNTEYTIVSPHMGPVVVVLDAVDNIIYRMCPFVAAGVVIGSIYWTAVTYGAVTIMQVCGHKEGMSVMEGADPLVLLIGLPTIPIALVLGKMLRWEETVLGFLRRHSHKVPVLRHVLPAAAGKADGAIRELSCAQGHSGKAGGAIWAGSCPVLKVTVVMQVELSGSCPVLKVTVVTQVELSGSCPVLKVTVKLSFPCVFSEDRSNEDVPPLSDPLSATRIFCSALLTPTMATIFGRMFFNNVHSNLQKTLLGGVAFIAIKGVLKIYHKQQQYVSHSHRRILDHNAANVNAVNPPSQ
uniref:E3 ubiquitin-protein ligase MARCHF5 n=1 Tax=Timema genevievae TaxID=629358 RepID=A0A7R9K1V2_TIMGE|nr:unnamed protein product [Timema genevievae]